MEMQRVDRVSVRALVVGFCVSAMFRMPKNSALKTLGPLLDEVCPQDVSHRLCAIAGTELVQDVPEMGFNRSFGHH